MIALSVWQSLDYFIGYIHWLFCYFTTFSWQGNWFQSFYLKFLTKSTLKFNLKFTLNFTKFQISSKFQIVKDPSITCMQFVMFHRFQHNTATMSSFRCFVCAVLITLGMSSGVEGDEEAVHVLRHKRTSTEAWL